MRLRFYFSRYAWIIVIVFAVTVLAWSNYERAKRVEYVTNTDFAAAAIDANSPTGYAHGERWLIVPNRNDPSYQWIAETQQMFAQRDWRIRHIDYDNAPYGRNIYTGSLYRWWLGLIAACDHLMSGRSLGLSVEKAAIFADPVIHLLLLIGTVLFVAKYFGTFPAAVLGVGLTATYPFAGEFFPGMPDEHSLVLSCSLWSVLPLLAAAWTDLSSSPSRAGSAPLALAQATARTSRLFFLAGAAGGVGLWIGTVHQTLVVLGIAFGGFLAAAIAGRQKENAPETLQILPWRVWAFGGAATCLAAYVIEYFPAHMDFHLEVNHPLYGLAWIGLGELLAQIESWFKKGKSSWSYRQAIILVLAVAALAALPVEMALHKTPSLLIGDPLASRLSVLPSPVVAKNLFAWIVHSGPTAAFGTTCLPLLVLACAGWLIMRTQTGRWQRTSIALAVGPVLVTLVLACLELRWWSLCDAMLIALVVPVATVASAFNRWWSAGLAAGIFLPGLTQLIPPIATRENIEFTQVEVESLLERDLAHWIADHADPEGAVILVPPDRTTSWCFHGGMRGLGSAIWENRDGLAATVRIVTATTEAEALALIRERGVTHIVLPSWDADLDEFARWSLRNPEDAFVMALHHWALPTWLRPLPYQLPTNVGFKDQSVAIFKVADESNRPTALSRLAEYFIESQQIDLAASAATALQRYPADLAALVALAEVEKATRDTDGFAKTFETVSSSLAAGADRSLPWDRRVSLAVVLAQGGRNDLSQAQVQRCLEKLDETRIRSLTTGSLFRLQALCKAFGLQISDPRLRELSAQLLPAELRERL